MSTQPVVQPTATFQGKTTNEPSLPDLSVLAVPDGHVLSFRARAKGVQIYPYDPATHTFGSPHPEAILLTDDGELIHHSTGPTWQAADGSSVVGKKEHGVHAPVDDAIDWLLLSATTHGGSAVGKLSQVSFIQRVYTRYGKAPSPDGVENDAAAEIPVFYEAEYFFYIPQ
jgi:Protein of unknown function (DUF3455)